MSSFRPIFIAVAIGGSLIVAAFVINSLRPKIESQQPAAAFVRATGKCAECHRRETSAVVHQFEGSRHVQVGVTCLDCHQAVDGQEKLAHRGFTIAKALTAANCRQCHATEYRQYLRSRHAAPAWAAVPRSGRFHCRANRLRRAVPSRRDPAQPQSAGRYGRPGGRHQGLFDVPRRRQAERRRLDRHLHRLSRTAFGLGRAGPDAGDLRPVPHGPGPFPDRDLP